MIAQIKGLIDRLLLSLRLRKYDEWTIEDYFRSQGVRIGHGNRIYIRDFGTEPYLVKIGDHCTITAGVRFVTHDGAAWVFRRDIPDLNIFGKIEVKDNCFIGIGSIILPDVTIGPDSVVGAGSVVTRDVPPRTVVGGIPAREICTLEAYREKTLKKWKELNLSGRRSTWERQL
ncbi:MAG: acyltransferase, partial [Deltaproteobacteria bacterium]